MKILVISANYPPLHSGGYEIRIKNIIDELFQRGHLVRVITSKCFRMAKNADIKIKYPVLRKLHEKSLKKNWIDLLTAHSLTRVIGLGLVGVMQLIHDILDLKAIDHIISEFHPDIIYLGHILPLTRTLFPYLADLQIPIVLDDGGGTLFLSNKEKGIWFKLIEGDTEKISIIDGFKPLIIRLVGLLSKHRIKPDWNLPNNMQILFKREANLNAVKNAGISVEGAVVLHSGVDINLFNFVNRNAISLPVTIIYPARIEPRKGQLDALKLLSHLVDAGIDSRLILVGEARSSFIVEFQDMVRTLDIKEYLEICLMMPHEEIVSYYQQADLVFFPSYWKDGLSRVPLEAMACGCIVISYGNEGSYEIIRDGENGFLVDPGNYDAITEIIKTLISDPKQVARITNRARLDIESNYALDAYVDQIEDIIYDYLESQG